MDLFAAEAGLDPVEVRRRNLIPKFDEPYTTASRTDLRLRRLRIDARRRARTSRTTPTCEPSRRRRRESGDAAAARHRRQHLRRDHRRRASVRRLRTDRGRTPTAAPPSTPGRPRTGRVTPRRGRCSPRPRPASRSIRSTSCGATPISPRKAAARWDRARCNRAALLSTRLRPSWSIRRRSSPPPSSRRRGRHRARRRERRRSTSPARHRCRWTGPTSPATPSPRGGELAQETRSQTLRADLPVRRPPGRRRGRHRDRPGESDPSCRLRRRRGDDQPAARRGSGARRHRPRGGAGPARRGVLRRPTATRSRRTSPTTR